MEGFRVQGLRSAGGMCLGVTFSMGTSMRRSTGTWIVLSTICVWSGAQSGTQPNEGYQGSGSRVQGINTVGLRVQRIDAWPCLAAWILGGIGWRIGFRAEGIDALAPERGRGMKGEAAASEDNTANRSKQVCGGGREELLPSYWHDDFDW